MRVLGIIYTNSKNFKTLSGVIVKPISEFDENIDLPSLILGKNNAIEIFGENNVKVLNKTLTENVSWTYSKMEKRNEFEKDLEFFYKKVFNTLNKSIKYRSISMYTITYNQIKALINYINNNVYKCCYITNDNIYVYCNDLIYGISKRELEYIGIKEEKIMRYINNSKMKLISSNFKIPNDIKEYLKNDTYMIAAIFCHMCGK